MTMTPVTTMPFSKNNNNRWKRRHEQNKNAKTTSNNRTWMWWYKTQWCGWLCWCIANVVDGQMTAMYCQEHQPCIIYTAARTLAEGICNSLRIRLYVVLRIRDFPYNPMTWGWDWEGVWILRDWRLVSFSSVETWLPSCYDGFVVKP